MDKLIITPKTKVGELLDAYPQLEQVLMDLSPAFEKLKNPVLRKTVARVATLSQIAIVGGLKVEEIVNTLRKETGQDQFSESESLQELTMDTLPDWVSMGTITEIYDAVPFINAGESPMSDILAKTKNLKVGEIFEFHTPFVPAPIIGMLQEKGFVSVSAKDKDIFKTYVRKT